MTQNSINKQTTGNNVEINELGKLLKPYTQKIIKLGLLLSRVPDYQSTELAYTKMSTWLDDIARFITLTSTFSKTHMNQPEHMQMRSRLQSTNSQIVDQLSLLSQLLKSDETLIPELIETKILPLMILWNKEIISDVKSVIEQSR